jgi:hypothetical protein
MTAIEPPFACQGRADHPASLFRMMLAGAAGAPFAVGNTSPAGGVDPYLGNAMAITGLASLNVQVGTGLVMIPNTTAWNGMYAGYNSATFNLAIAAASSTQWRTDRVDAVVVDPGDATANWNVVVTTGVFSSSSPGATPAAPANSVPLARILVVPNMTVTNGGGTVVDARVFTGLKGVFKTTSAAKPSLTCPEGTMWVESDTHQIGIILNGAYLYLVQSSRASADDPWHAFNPLSNAWAVGSGGFAQYRYSDDGRSIKISAKNLTPGTKTDGTIISTNFPAGYRPINNHEFPIAADALGGLTAGMARCTLDTTGNLKIFGVNAGTLSEISFDAEIPLDL